MAPVPTSIEPADGEVGVLSVLAVEPDQGWSVVSGSLLAVPKEIAEMSWKAWQKAQPSTGRPDPDLFQLDPGPEFDEQPFPRVRIVRAIVKPTEWQQVTQQIESGKIERPDGPLAIDAPKWSPVVQLTTQGDDDAARTVRGLMRRASAVVAMLAEQTMPPTQPAWIRSTASYQESLGGWCESLLGIEWPPGTDIAPPAFFVLGRAHCDAWIADVRPREEGEVSVYVGWERMAVDPLGCTLLVTSSDARRPMLRRQVRISDLPGPDAPTPTQLATHQTAWDEGLLQLTVPRGPRRTEWGAALFAADGALLDEWPVAARVEAVHLSIQVMGSDEPGTAVSVGDPQPAPSAAEQSGEAETAAKLEDQARIAAGERRISTLGDLEGYLRWRLSCRGGELLLLDPYLFGSQNAAVLRILTSLDRPIRAMAPALPPGAALAGHPQINARKLPGGKGALHDRVWMIGETALLVGTSLNSISKRRRATTVSELPQADAALWRKRFEEWWSEA